jgi:heme exporter protein C
MLLRNSKASPKEENGMKERIMQRSNILPGTSFVLMMVALYLVFVYVPTEQTMGIVQRIFYFHVPIAWLSYLAFAVVLVCSILYLRTREGKWDIIARSSAEVGIIFTTLVLITGSLWGKAAWGVWWTWDARLTSELVLWLIYIAYLMVRSFAVEEDRGARFAAVIGIAGFFSVPLSALAITLWRTQHPRPLIFEGGLVSSMLFTLMFCVITFTVLYVLLLIQRVSLRKIENEINKLKHNL